MLTGQVVVHLACSKLMKLLTPSIPSQAERHLSPECESSNEVHEVTQDFPSTLKIFEHTHSLFSLAAEFSGQLATQESRSKARTLSTGHFSTHLSPFR